MFSSKKSTGIIISFRKWRKGSQIINKILWWSWRVYPYIQSTENSFKYFSFKLYFVIDLSNMCPILSILLSLLITRYKDCPFRSVSGNLFPSLKFSDFLFLIQNSGEMKVELSEEKSFLWKVSSVVTYNKVSSRWVVKWLNLTIWTFQTLNFSQNLNLNLTTIDFSF